MTTFFAILEGAYYLAGPLVVVVHSYHWINHLVAK